MLRGNTCICTVGTFLWNSHGVNQVGAAVRGIHGRRAGGWPFLGCGLCALCRFGRVAAADFGFFEKGSERVAGSGRSASGT